MEALAGCPVPLAPALPHSEANMAHHRLRLRGFLLSVPLLLLVGIGQASAQVAPTPPAESARTGSTAGDNTPKQEDGVRRENRAADSQPAAAPPSIRYETV